MVDYIIPKKDVLDLYRKQKSEFNFHQRSDDDFIIFLLDTASRVLSIAHQLTPVIEAVSYEAEGQQMETTDAEESESQENIMPQSELESDPTSIQPLPEVQSHMQAAAPCKIESMSCQDDAIFQLAKEIESVANTLLDEQCNNTTLSSEISNPKSAESENLIIDPSKKKKGSPLPKLLEKNFKSSVAPLPYSMLDMANIQNDSNIDTSPVDSDETLNSLSLVPGSKRSSLSSKPTERSLELKVYQVDPKGNCHELMKSKQRRCKICHKIRRKSCSICDVGLCQQECFRLFHKKFATYNMYVEKYQCFGRNHRARINNLPYGVPNLISQSNFGNSCNSSFPDSDSKNKHPARLEASKFSSGNIHQKDVAVTPSNQAIVEEISNSNKSALLHPNKKPMNLSYNEAKVEVHPLVCFEAKNVWSDNLDQKPITETSVNKMFSQNVSSGSSIDQQPSNSNTPIDSSAYDLTNFVNSFESAHAKTNLPDNFADKRQ